jgi:hypothetical protein
LKREEAVRVIQEIEAECKTIRGTSIMLMKPNETDLRSSGFQVQIKIKATPERLRCLGLIASQYGYDVRVGDDNSTVTVYSPLGKKEPEAVATGIM